MARRRGDQVWVGRDPDWLDVELGPADVHWDPIPWAVRLVVCERFWIDHRDEILAEWPRVDSRPWAWWEFDAQEDMPLLDDQPARLAELGEITAQELAAAEERMARRAAGERWRSEPPTSAGFDRRSKPNRTEEEPHDG